MLVTINNMEIEVITNGHTLQLINHKRGCSLDFISLTEEGMEAIGWDKNISLQEARDSLMANHTLKLKSWRWVVTEWIGCESSSANWSPDLDPRGFTDFSIQCLARWVNRYILAKGTLLKWK